MSNHRNLKNSTYWANYLKTINWQTIDLNGNNVYIRNIPLFKRKLIKIQRPLHPITPQQVDSLQKKYNPLTIIIEPDKNAAINLEEFKKRGWSESKTVYAQSATVHVDISKDEEELLMSFSENARRQIKKAKKNKLTTQTFSFTSQIDKNAYEEFWVLWDLLTTTKGFYKLPKDEMYRKLETSNTISHMIFAYEENTTKPIAVVWYAVFDDVLYYLHTGINQKGYDLAANYLLVWEGMKLGKKHGCTSLDFEGAFDPRLPRTTKRWKGFTEFKLRFHGELVYYPMPLVKNYSPLFSIFHKIGEFLTIA